jgi:uncharacterized membrane protein YhdT
MVYTIVMYIVVMFVMAYRLKKTEGPVYGRFLSGNVRCVYVDINFKQQYLKYYIKGK